MNWPWENVSHSKWRWNPMYVKDNRVWGKIWCQDGKSISMCTRSQANADRHIYTYWEFTVSVYPACLCLGCGRKPESLEEAQQTHGEHASSKQPLLHLRCLFDTGSYLLWFRSLWFKHKPKLCNSIHAAIHRQKASALYPVQTNWLLSNAVSFVN